MRRAVLVGVGVAVALVLGCEREQRRFSEVAPSNSLAQPARQSDLQPGTPAPPAPPTTPRPETLENPYAENAQAIAEGKRLFSWFNCTGCHANGGGGMGPALIDEQWIYGGRAADIYASIVEGRPNGMPSYGGKIPDQQVWWLVAYVQALSGQLRKDVRPGREDHMAVRPSEQRGLPGRREPPPRQSEGSR